MSSDNLRAYRLVLSGQSEVLVAVGLQARFNVRARPGPGLRTRAPAPRERAPRARPDPRGKQRPASARAAPDARSCAALRSPCTLARGFPHGDVSYLPD